MESEFRSAENRQISVIVPEKHFNKWLREQGDITRLNIRCDLAKASFPYFTLIILLVLTGIIYPTALVTLAPALVIWILRNLKSRA